MTRLALGALCASLCAFGLCAGGRIAEARPLELSLEVAPTAGGLDDTYIAAVRIEVLGITGPERYEPPRLKGFRIADHRTNSTRVMATDPVRGEIVTTSILHRYWLKPTRRGRLAVGPAKITVNGRVYRTRRAIVEVGQKRLPVTASEPRRGGDPSLAIGPGIPGFVPPPASKKTERAFLHAVIDAREAYVGEQVTVTWLLYTRAEVAGFEPSPPDLSGFWSVTLKEPPRFFRYYDTSVGGAPFLAVVVSQRALFPLTAGRAIVPPLAAEVTTTEDPLWPGNKLASAPLVLDVKPLPAGAPDGFDPRHVGRFELGAAVASREIDAGEAFALSVTVSGEGAIGRTEAPVLAWDGFRIHRPRDFRESILTDGGTVRGTRTYSYWVSPERGGAQTLPGIELAYFDPDTGTYQVAKTPPIPVLVRGDPGDLGIAQASGDRVLPEDIRLIHTAAKNLGEPETWLRKRPLLWALVAIPPLLFAIVVGIDRLRRMLRRETPRVRLRRARGRARARLKVADIHLRGGRTEEFFGELSRALIDSLEEQLGRSLSSMTRGELRAYLGERQLPGSTVAALVNELEIHDKARFAPTEAGEAEMRAALRRVRDLLRKIERAPLDSEEAA